MTIFKQNITRHNMLTLHRSETELSKTFTSAATTISTCKYGSGNQE